MQALEKKKHNTIWDEAYDNGEMKYNIIKK